MDNVEFDKLNSLSIVELEAIYSFSQAQSEAYHEQLEKYRTGKIEATSMNRIGNICSFYEQLSDECRNIIDGKIYAIIGKPEF